MARQARGVSVKDLYGGRFISPQAVRRSMAGLEKGLTAEFKERARARAQLAKLAKQYQAPLLESLSRDQRAIDAVKGMRALHKAARGRKLRVAPLRPPKGVFNPGFNPGMLGATVGPPYDYQWTWSAVSGKSVGNAETADSSSGDLSIRLWTDDNDSSAVSGRVAVGIYFYPPAANGNLQIWSSPAFAYEWWTYCGLASAHADGWIGLYVGSYDLTGAPTGAVVDQQVTLWSDDSWFTGAGDHQGSNSGFGLYAPPVPVDQDHQYIIWVWCGGDVSAAGWGLFSGSGAGDSLQVHAPYITWELL